MSKIEYRKLSSDDLPLALAMNRDFREGFAEKSSLRAFLSSPDCWLFAAVLENRIVGFAYGYALQRLNTGRKMLYIHEVGVLDEYQRQGIGTKLINGIMEKYPHVYQMELLTDNTEKTICFYKSVGFRPADEMGCISFIRM